MGSGYDGGIGRHEKERWLRCVWKRLKSHVVAINASLFLWVLNV